jgi:hypothetical protein
VKREAEQEQMFIGMKPQASQASRLCGAFDACQSFLLCKASSGGSRVQFISTMASLCRSPDVAAPLPLFSVCALTEPTPVTFRQVLLFLLLQPVELQADPQLLEARHLLARKQLLLDPENGTLKK